MLPLHSSNVPECESQTPDACFPRFNAFDEDDSRRQMPNTAETKPELPTDSLLPACI